MPYSPECREGVGSEIRHLLETTSQVRSVLRVHPAKLLERSSTFPEHWRLTPASGGTRGTPVDARSMTAPRRQRITPTY
jgi:hypothetical protein